MSYILDALRKADAQRERDPARGIHAQPLRDGSARAGSRRGPAWRWAAGAAGIAVLGSAAWYAWQDRPAQPIREAARAQTSLRIPSEGAAPVAAPAPVVGA